MKTSLTNITKTLYFVTIIVIINKFYNFAE